MAEAVDPRTNRDVEMLDPNIPTMYLSQNATWVLINNGLQIDVDTYVNNPAKTPHNTGLAISLQPEANTLIVPADVFMKSVQNTLRLQLLIPNSPVKPSFEHALSDEVKTIDHDLRVYENLLSARTMSPEHAQELRSSRNLLEARLSVLAGLRYYQDHADIKLHLEAYIPDKPRINQYYAHLARLDHNYQGNFSSSEHQTGPMPIAAPDRASSSPSHTPDKDMEAIRGTFGINWKDNS